MLLHEMKPGEEGMITGLDSSEALVRRLLALGVCPGLRLRVVRNAPLRDPMEVEIDRRHLSLRRDEARCIEVKPA